MKNPLLQSLRREIKRAADPQKAAGMQRYMKSPMPYWGTPAPALKKLCRVIFKDLTFPNAAAWERAVRAIWREATHREERYAAIALTGIKAAAEFQSPLVMPLYEHLIVDGAWWDFVDVIASHRVGAILRDHPTAMKRLLKGWSKAPDIWQRRTAILSQLTFKDTTNLTFLYGVIEPSLSSQEFFLRKAIGWALRQYAWTDPKEIVRYVRANKDRLSPLSQREALKNIKD